MRTPIAAALALTLLSGAAFAAETMVGGAPMYSNKTIVQNASNAKNLTTLVAAVKEAGLVDALNGKGPFTVFAPTNKAFDALPKGTVESLMKPENKDRLKKILTYHVVPGKMDSKELMADVKKHNGKAMLKTVEGEDIAVTDQGGKLKVTDAEGHTADVVTPNVEQSNGVVHVIDKVLLPK